MIAEAVATHSYVEIKEVFEKQKRHFFTIKNSPAYTRIAKLKKMMRYIMEHRPEIHEAIYRDFKKPATEVDMTEVFSVVGEIKFTIKNLRQWMKPKKVDTPLTLLGSTSKVYYEPKGVSLIVSPWNYPFFLAMTPLVYAIAAGNCVIIKPSEMTPHTSAFMRKMISDLFEEEEIVLLEGGVDVSTELLKLPFDHIYFTGGTQIGKVVMKAAAENLSSVTLELGGKSPLIMDASANIEDTAEKLVWGKFVNAGQTCIAPDYVLCPANKKAALVTEIRKNIKKAYDPEGLGIEKSSSLARIVNEKHFNRLTGYIEDAIEKGATLELGGNTNPSDYFIEPTVLSNVDNEMTLMQDEIFGPILPIVTYNHLEEAIRFVEGKPKPLALYVFSSDNRQTRRLMENTTAGGTCINDCLLHITNPELPFGGVNSSGIGKANGHNGFLQFTNERAVLDQRVGMTSIKPLYPPYNGLVQTMVDAILKWL